MTARIELAKKLDLNGAEALLASLRGAEGDVVLDGSGVTQFGALAAQTVMVAARDFAATGRTLTVEALPEAAVEQLARMGLSPALLTNGG